MVEHGYIVRTNPSSIVWPHFWQPVHESSMPHEGHPVWAYSADIGNEDEGYGYVELAVMWSGKWRSLVAGGDLTPVFWADITAPEVPISWPTKDETVAKAQDARRDVVERRGPFAIRG